MGHRSLRPDPSPDVIRGRVQSLPRRFRSDAVNGLSAEWELRVGSQTFAISVADHACFVREGPSPLPEAVVTTEPATWLDIDDGSITGGQAFLDRRLSVVGNLDLAVRMQTLFRPYRRRRGIADLDQIEVDAGGVRISTYVLGKGSPVLLAHGLGGTKVTWFPILGELAAKHRLIVPDLPGHGESEKPRAEYSPKFYAHVMRCLMDELEVDQAAVVGNSLGGRVALEMALRSPNRVTSLALLDPSMPGLRWRYVLGFGRVVPSELGAFPFVLRERWMQVAIRRLFAHPERMAPDNYAAGATEFIRIYRSPEARMAFFSSLAHIMSERPEAFFGSLRRIKHPALVMFGERDRLVPLRLGMRLAQYLPNARMVVLPDVGHVPQFEAPTETLAELVPFLAPSRPAARR
jgi:pimeloyl-ACP methyl ester carboxylesterase/putative sterol carrier protein